MSGTVRFALSVGLVLAIALGLVHPELLLSGKIYASADANAAGAFSTLGREAQRAGEVPLWNPFIFGGMPSYASFGFLPDVYPLQQPLRWLTETLHLPPMSWMLFHVWLFGWGTALYLRWRGLGWASATMAGLCALVLPPVVAWGVHGHGTKIGTIAWWPFAVWSLEWALRRGSKLAAAAFGAVLALMLLRYHVQMFYYAILALFIYALVLLLRDRRRVGTWTSVGFLILAAALALGISAQIYLPVWEYQSHSIRGVAAEGGGASYEFATNWSLAPSEVSTFVWPTAVGYGSGSYVGQMPFTDYPNYLGIPLFLLVVAALIWRRGYFLFAWLAIASLSLFISFGKHGGGLYDLFYRFAPLFDKFRVPSMILALFQFAVLLLAAEGLDALTARWAALAKDKRRIVFVGLMAAGVVYLFLATLGGSALRESSISRWQSLRPQMPVAGLEPALRLAQVDAVRLALLFFAAAALLQLSPRRVSARHLGFVLALIPFLDLYAVTTPIRHPERWLERPVRSERGIDWVPAPAMLADPPQAIDGAGSALAQWLRQQEPRPRVWPIGVQSYAVQNDLAAEHIVNLGGYHAAKLQVTEELRRRIFDANPPAVRLVNLLATRWVIVGQQLDAQTLDALAQLGMRLSEEPVFVGEEGIVYENLSAQPRAFVVEGYELAALPEPTQLDRIASGRFDAANSVLLGQEPTPLPESGAAQGQAAVLEEGFDWVRLSASLPAAGLLVLADIYYPGWEAWVDGVPVAVYRADYALRAIALGSGDHEVEFRISGGSYALGRRISGLSALALCLMLLLTGSWEWRRRRNMNRT